MLPSLASRRLLHHKRKQQEKVIAKAKVMLGAIGLTIILVLFLYTKNSRTYINIPLETSLPPLPSEFRLYGYEIRSSSNHTDVKPSSDIAYSSSSSSPSSSSSLSSSSLSTNDQDDSEDSEYSDTSSSSSNQTLDNFCLTLERNLTYVYLHLHKTAGNNLKPHLFGFSKKNNLTAYHTCRPVTHPESVSKRLMHGSLQPKKIVGKDYDCDLEEFRKFSSSQRDSFDFIVGHQMFGVHTLLNKREAVYFTMFRHPVPRKISHFGHFEASRDLSHPDMEKLRHYLLNENKNYVTKRLTGNRIVGEIEFQLREKLIDTNVNKGHEALHSAMLNLINSFFFVGILERYEESICVLIEQLNHACYAGDPVLHKKLKLDKVLKTHENKVGETFRVLQSLPGQLIKEVSKTEALDLELYKFASSLFEEKLSHYPQCQYLT